MKIRLRHAFGAALVCLALSGCVNRSSQQQPAPRPNVLLITLDTFRADRIGAYGYELASTPNLDRLAREGVRFTDATTQAPLTAPAHAALLTGLYPARLGVKDNASTPLPESVYTLAETLSESGYKTAAFIGAFVVDRPYGFAQGFDTFDAVFQGYTPELKQQVQRLAGEVADSALNWLKLQSGGVPFFAWVHLYDAHHPYSAPAPFGARFSDRPYDGEIAYVDAAVGRLLAALADAGVLEQTIVVAVADHGEALGEHGEDDHGMFLYEGVLRIPWIVRLPKADLAGNIVAEQVRAIDVTPTLLDLAGLRVKAPVDGTSVASVMRGQARRDPPLSYADAHFPQLHFGWSMLRSLRAGEWKYIDAPKPELYNVRTDRSEQRNLVQERASVATRMAAEVRAIWQSFGSAAAAAPVQPDPETLARLRSLGYVGVAAPTPGDARGADPKDKIAELKLFRGLISRAIDDLTADRTDAAIEKLKRALAINERAYDVHLLLGDAWAQKGVNDRALGEYDAAALLNPVVASPHLLAAEVLLALNDAGKALERIGTAAKLEPTSAEVPLSRGRIYERMGRLQEALAEYQHSVTQNPSHTPARARLVGAAMNLKRFDIAEPQLRVLVQRRYQLERTHYALGVIAESRGDRASAAQEYRSALAVDPSFRQAAEALQRVSLK